MTQTHDKLVNWLAVRFKRIDAIEAMEPPRDDATVVARRKAKARQFAEIRALLDQLDLRPHKLCPCEEHARTVAHL